MPARVLIADDQPLVPEATRRFQADATLLAVAIR